MKKISLKIMVLGIIALISPITTFALGFEISPARFEKTVMPGTTEEINLKIKNKGRDVTATFSVNDFTFKDESGTPLIVEEGIDDPNFSLSRWITVPRDIELKGGEQNEAKIIINIPEDATPGGHYGTIFVQQQAEDLGSGKVSAVTKIGALVILKVKGEIKEKANLESFSLLEEMNEEGELVFVTRFKNTGNVHLSPKGKIYLMDESGKVLDSIDSEGEKNELGIVVGGKRVNYLKFNKEGFLVLPGQIRKYSSKIRKEMIKGGKYQARLEIVYGGENARIESDMVDFTITEEEEKGKKIEVIVKSEAKTDRSFMYVIIGLGVLIVIVGSAVIFRKKK